MNVADLPISTRLRNILIRNHISDLFKVSEYTPGQIIRFRNMGEKTYHELQDICADYGISLELPSSNPHPVLPPALQHLRISHSTKQQWAENGIESISDFRFLNIESLYLICGNDYGSCMNSYYFLQKQGILLRSEEKKYLFEYFNSRLCNALWTQQKIKTLTELSKLSSKEIIMIRGVGRKSLIKIASVVNSH